MAIDTAAKRHSIRHLGMPWRGPAVVPSGTVNQGERQTFLNYYSGIAWSGAAAGSILLLVSEDMAGMRNMEDMRG